MATPQTVPFRPEHLFNLPGLLTLSRLPIAVAFPFLAHDRVWALTFYTIAIISDMLDGPLARARGQDSQIGAAADGWMDKILHVNAAWSLYLLDMVPGWFLLAWFSREIQLFPMSLVLCGRMSQGRLWRMTPSRLGRCTSIALSLAFYSTLLDWRAGALAFTLATGLLGTTAGLDYLRNWRTMHGQGDLTGTTLKA